MNNYICIIILGLVCSICSLGLSNKAFGQELDYSNIPGKSYKVAILAVKPPIQEIFANSVNYIGSRVGQKLRLIPGIEALNMASSLRILERSKAKKNFKTLTNDIINSELPDPYDLYEIASVLDANKIMVIAGSFDTQIDILNRSTKSMVNPFAMYSIKPQLDYSCYIYLFDPVTGNLEWSQIYRQRFPVKDFYITTSQLFESPVFTDKFDKYTVLVSEDIYNNLQQKLYEMETASVTAKIVPQPAFSSKATEGEMTTDGHPIINDRAETVKTDQFIGPITEPKYENTSTGLETPYSSTENKEYNNSLIQDYQKNILEKY